MDSRSLFLTANADTVYFWTYLDLTQGPVVVETPPDTLGIFDDMWFGWVSDFGLPGADRGQGGSYLLVPPGYDGSLPEGGFIIRQTRTTHLALIGRAFVDNNQGNHPGPSATRIKEQLKIYPYVPGGVGNSIGAYLTGRGPLGQLASPRTPRFVEGLDWRSIRSRRTTLDTTRCSMRLCSWSRRRRSTRSWPASSPPSGS